MRRIVTGLALGALVSAVPVGSARAQGLTFDESEVAAQPQAPTDVARYLQEGLDYYEREDFTAASVFFWRVANEKNPSADLLRLRAQYELARTLVRMRLLQGAIFFFDEVIATGPSHPYFEASAPWLILIARRLPGDLDMLRRVAAFEEVFPDRMEEKYRDEMAFMLGQHFYNVGELEKALRYLSFVTQISPYYPKATYLQGITHIRRYDAGPASEKFKELLRVVEEMKGRDPEVVKLGELARLSMARTFYSTAEFEKSIEYYERIEQGSPYWLDALFESSWAYFQTDRYNRALGNLHSLNSPFFNDEYYPEAPILQAVIYFYNCRFDGVRATLEEFALTYQPLREQLEARLGEMKESADYYEFVRRSDKQLQGEFDPRLQQILGATLSDSAVVNAMSFIEELEREVRFIEKADPGWAKSELADYLYQELLATRELSITQTGDLVKNRLESIRDELRQKERDASAILIESDLAEADAISAELRGELFTGKPVEDLARADNPEVLFWRFDGEYWRDELGYYSYKIRSACGQ